MAEAPPTGMPHVGHPTMGGPWGKGPPPFLKMSIYLNKPDPRDADITLKDSYQAWEYFVAPRSQRELMHKYSVLRRQMFGVDTTKQDPESKPLVYYLFQISSGIQDIRKMICENLDIKTRFYLAIPIALSPLYLAKRRSLKRVIPVTFFTWYWLLPEHLKAILRAN